MSIEPQQAIVCVDDDELVLHTLREQLLRGLDVPCTVETVSSGAEALLLLDELADEGVAVPLLISDQQMPGMGGTDLLALAHKRFPDMLKVMLSGEVDAQAVGDAVNRAGLYRILYKPWSQDDLVLTVREALRSVAQQRALFESRRDLERSLVQVQYQALHDALTGLPNRQQFDDAIRVAIDRARDKKERLAVLFIDLDRFKRINDSLGHLVGDSLLLNVVERLQKTVRKNDLIARWGGDEFTILLSQIADSDEAHLAAQRVLSALESVFLVSEHPLHISASIGVAIYPEDGDNAQTLVKNADTALFRMKSEGRNGWRAYKESWGHGGDTPLALESALYSSLPRGELLLHYQPQVDANTGIITHVEALARWCHPRFGMVPPGVFIPLAEETGLITSIGEWVLYESCRQAMAWSQQGLNEIGVCVNVSGLQIERTNFPETVRKALAETGLPAHRLEIEVTEAIGLRDSEATATSLRQINAMGVMIALDDFGTGFAPLSHVKELPSQCLKIDRSFVIGLERGSKNAAIVAAVSALGRGLGLRVVAEGVECPEVANVLREMGCTSFQGYLFGRPLDAERLGAVLRQQNDTTTGLFRSPELLKRTLTESI